MNSDSIPTSEKNNGLLSGPEKPLVCLGMPLYNQTRFLPQALESILAQTYPDFKLIVMDDSTDPGPGNLIKQYASKDARISYTKNASRKGLVGNWRACFELAGDADYFAWVSDHDIWHPEWLASLVKAMNTHPEAVLAYPFSVPVDIDGRRHPKKKPFVFSTDGLDVARRIKAVSLDARKYGYMVYGLFRASSLHSAGIFRRLLFPDAILMHELCLLGPFVQVDSELWYRRKDAEFSIARQRRSLFVQKPWYIYLPWPLVNAAALAWNMVLQPLNKDLKYRYGGAKIALFYFFRQMGHLGDGSWVGSYYEWRHAKKPWIVRLKKRYKKRRLSKAG